MNDGIHTMRNTAPSRIAFMLTSRSGGTGNEKEDNTSHLLDVLALLGGLTS